MNVAPHCNSEKCVPSTCTSVSALRYRYAFTKHEEVKLSTRGLTYSFQFPQVRKQSRKIILFSVARLNVRMYESKWDFTYDGEAQYNAFGGTAQLRERERERPFYVST